MKKVVVLGSTGMAGHVVSLYLEEHGYDVYRISRSQKEDAKSVRLDACDFTATGYWLDHVAPDVIVNCIGLLQRTAQERPDCAVLVNAYLPHWLESKYAASQCRVIHLSTDCVFSGKRGGYKEDDPQDGDMMYDRSKALGEINNDKDLTLRMSIIGPDIDSTGTGLFNWFMKQSGTISGYTKVIWNGITTIELARGIDAAIRKSLNGLYQLVPQKLIDKYSLLCLFQKVFDKNDVSISKNEAVVMDKSLINTRRDFDFAVKGYPEQIEDMKAWVEKHKQLYPHYSI